MNSGIVVIVYTNHRSETAERRIVPLALRFTHNEWHPETQWLLDAVDVDKNGLRSFAMKDIKKWRDVSQEESP